VASPPTARPRSCNCARRTTCSELQVSIYWNKTNNWRVNKWSELFYFSLTFLFKFGYFISFFFYRINYFIFFYTVITRYTGKQLKKVLFSFNFTFVAQFVFCYTFIITIKIHFSIKFLFYFYSIQRWRKKKSLISKIKFLSS
jgi:hypothetical protein